MRFSTGPRRAKQPLKGLRSLALAAMVGVSFAFTAPVVAQEADTVRVMVGYPAGAGTDTLARIYAEALNKLIGVNAVVENRPGAGGLLAVHALARAPEDNNMVMMTIDHQVLMLPLVLKDPGFEVERDLLPIARVMTFYTCLAVPAESPATTLKEFIELAKKDQTKASYGVPAPGSQAHFVGYVVGQHFDVDLQSVPYRGAAPAITDLLGNQVPAIVVPCDGLTEYVKAGKIRVLGIAADERSPLIPETPTFAELGIEMPTANFVAVYASSKIDPQLREKLVTATREMFQMPDIVERFNATGMIANYGSPQELNDIWKKSIGYWADKVRESNFQVQ